MMEQNILPAPKWSKTFIFWGATLLLFVVSMFTPFAPDTIAAIGSIAILSGFYGVMRLKNIFGPMKRKKKLLFFSLLILSFVSTIGVDILLSSLGSTANDHPLFQDLNSYSPVQILILLFTLFIGMIGEEVITAIFTFPVWGWLREKGLSSSLSFFLAAVFSSLIFGLFHLPIYGWNWLQCLLTIGLTRIPYTYAWKQMNSIWGGILLHYLFDLILILLVLLPTSQHLH